jgi:hypothetical protein
MNRLFCCAAIAILLAGGKAFALGVDVGPVHLHGTKVKVGSTVDLKIIVDKVTMDDDEKERVKRIRGHRLNSDEKFEIKVPWGDQDDRSREILKNLKEEKTYEMKLERLDDDWKLQKIRKDD